MLDGDFSYFKKSKESKVKQALKDKIDELEYEALRSKHNERDIEEQPSWETKDAR